MIVRGIEKRFIVNDDEDRENFVTRMGELALETKRSVYAWALTAIILVTEMGLSMAETGRQLGLSTSGVAQILRRR